MATINSDSDGLSAPVTVDWSAVEKVFAAGGKFALTTHVRGDTDGIGSEIALCRFLTSKGCEVRILNPDSLPAHLALLDPDGIVHRFERSDQEFVDDATIVVLDVSNADRLGAMTPALASHQGTSICIDHHPGEKTDFTTHAVIDTTAAATGAMVFDLLRSLDAPIDQVTANALYAAIVADTGSFKFSNTSSTVLRIAADLVDYGAEVHPVTRAVMSTFSGPKIRLMARTLETPGFSCDERLIWFAASQALLDELDATDSDADGLVEYLRLHESVRVAIYFVELDDGSVKLSFRSQEGYNVNALARSFNGGGHVLASGAVVPGPLAMAVAEVVSKAEALFDEPG